MNRVFVWDALKAAANIEKHGVSFEEAVTVFVDELYLLRKDIAHSLREDRWERIGRTSSGLLLVVIYALRGGMDGQEKIRIISARKANRVERQIFARL